MAKKKTKSKPKSANIPSIAETINSEVIAAALSSTPPPIFMKVCRLCESKDGPFLNIFDADKVTAKKIDELMPFGVTENDDLPHKICFRCSAKLEELYEFIQKCIKTQESLRQALGKTGPFVTKTKTRAAWEQKLNKSNISNDDICDALIKKAMEGIKDIPVKDIPPVDPPASPPTGKRVTRNSEPAKLEVKQEPKTIDSDEDKPIAKIQQKEEVKEKEKVRPKKGSKAASSKSIAKPETTKKETNKKETTKKENAQIEKTEKRTSDTKVASITNFSLDFDDKNDSNIIEIPEIEKEPEPQKEKTENIPEEKPFDIYDYISTIKVNGVGILFQCKLCNRNFLKTDTVESHACARNRTSKVDIPKTPPVPEPPKIPNTVKYIKMDDEMKKTLSERAQKIENDKIISDTVHDEVPVEPIIPPKPRAGPASKTKRLKPVTETESDKVQPVSENPSPVPSLQFANMPNLNGRYKLVPGPNNSFTLVEESGSAPPSDKPKTSKKRKSDETQKETRVKEQKSMANNDEVIDLDEPSPPKSLPYPVGMFQTVGGTTRLCSSPPKEVPPSFTTPAMKKQSYTIVQTGHPSKLLISTKAKAAEPVEPVPKKKAKKKSDSKSASTSAEPFQVTLEDVEQPKDAGFFTFINVDPLLQPSYVLPTHNIIQESQISTSTAVRNQNTENKVNQKDNKYSCNMCGESFSREKKLLAHIQSHFTKMDEEDQQRTEKQPPKRKTRRS